MNEEKPCIKVRYTNRKSAVKSLLDLQEIRKRKNGKKETSIYLCKKCGKYHITSWTKRYSKYVKRRNEYDKMSVRLDKAAEILMRKGIKFKYNEG